jgi:RNA recognition motif-containing protein
MTKLYVGNLAWTATEENLTEFFSSYGAVHSAVVVKDRETGRSRGFGFVEMDRDSAENAIREANGQNLLGRPLRVSEAREREGGGGGGGGRDRGPRRSAGAPGGGGGGGGGYGGGGPRRR